ncbi:carbohydrate kinase family protein, partial [Nocardia brasiliensis]|uniref:carbohydrate kinase family protein n=1 Tax=Nocardia brasiliensis TaxID=37326 RepID=UPI002453AEBC
MAPDLTRPGAPDDTTLRPPVLDRANPHPHVIESPGVVADPAEPGYSPPPLPPVSDVPASMPDPAAPVRFRAGDDYPESPAGDRAADAVADGQGGSTEAEPDHSDVPGAAPSEESITASGPRVVVVGRPYFYCTIETNGFPALGESRLADSLRLTPGGEALNYARALARNGADVSLIGAIGDDRLGESIREMLEREGIGADGIRVVPGTPNPISICFIADSGVTSFIRNTARALELERRDIERHAARLRNADVVLIGAELPDEVAAAIDAVVAGSGVVVARSPAAGVGSMAQITVPVRRELEGALPLTLPQSAGPAGRIADPQSQPTETVEPPPHHPPVGLSAIEALASAAGSRAELLAELAGRKRVLAFGGAVGDLVINVDGFPDPGKSRDVSGVRPGPVDSVIPGGKTLNVAVAAARLGAVVDVVSAIGCDIPGDAIAELFRREGIGTRGIRIEPEVPTPICACFVDDDGEASFLWRIPRELELTDDDVESLSWAIQEAEGVGGKVDIFIVTYEVPEPALARIVAIARENDIKVVLQPAPVRSKFSLDTVRMVDLLVLNKIEAQVLLSTAIADVMDLPADRLAEHLYELLGVPTIAVTLGAAGCVVHHRGSTEVFAAHGVEAVVDTTGASDAFTAAFALGVFAQLPIALATQRALAAAAHTITRPGGHESMPYPDQLELRLANLAEQVDAEGRAVRWAGAVPLVDPEARITAPAAE